MKLSAPDLSAETRSSIERAIRAPADRPVELQGLVTTDLPTAADYPYGLLFDTTLGQPKFSNGTSWLTFSLSTHVHAASAITNTPAGNIAATDVQAAINELDTEKTSITEGTFTPALTFGGGSTGISYTNRGGRYSRIGNTVWLEILVNLASKGSSTGTALITGIPFTANGTLPQGIAAIRLDAVSGVTSPAGRIVQGENTVRLEHLSGGGVSQLNDTHFTVVTNIGISICYRV